MHENKFKLKTESPFTSSKKSVLSLKIKLFWMRYAFKILGCVAPPVSERMALRLFLSPPRNNIPAWQKPFLASAEQSTLSLGRKKIRVYRWGMGPAILLVHGWGGRGSQLGAFINPLINAGYSVLALDGPAHGDSSGKQSDMFEFASAIHAAATTVNSLHAIVAHSFGSACTLLAMHEHKLKVSRLILIGCPSSAIWITEDFARRLSVSLKIVAGMRKQLERHYGNKWTWEDLSLAKLIKEVSAPILLIHDRKDREVPYQQVLELRNANPVSELFISEGQGHRRILRSVEVINRVLTFI